MVSHLAMKTLLTSNMFLEEIRRQYVLTARAKGLSERRVRWKHVPRNTLLPLYYGAQDWVIQTWWDAQAGDPGGPGK